MHVLHVVGTRPNFIKAAPLLRALNCSAVHQTLVHSGQHYDHNMSDVFFEQLGMPQPDVNLQVGSDTHAQQTAAVMSRLEPVLLEHSPDLVVVYGDVNSTLAAALVAVQLGIPVAHVEAGLRSFDKTMPEEMNRVVTDQLADILLTPSADAIRNLEHAGVPAKRIHLVGNIMIDSLVHLLPEADRIFPALADRYCLDRYALVTVHRPSNVDVPTRLHALMRTLEQIASRIPILFPVHPRTRRRLESEGVSPKRVTWIDPLSYVEFLALQRRAVFVITDSGGIQEETSFLQIPCLTVRENTERPITVELGTNLLVGFDMPRLARACDAILSGDGKRGTSIPFWDGKTAERIASTLIQNEVLVRKPDLADAIRS